MMQESSRSRYSEAVLQKLLHQGTIVLDVAISDEVAKEIIAKLLFLGSRFGHFPIRLLINSPGGFVTPGMAIVDTIRGLGNLVQTCCMGEACAMAAIILASGSPGRRSAIRNAKMGFRKPEQPSLKTKEQSLEITQLLIQRTLQLTRISEAVLRDLMASGEELQPTRALELGIIDHMVEQCIPALN
jgi:ATP-dependent Clp protease protease subunit